MQNITDLKLSYLNKKSQLIILDEQGLIRESDNHLINISEYIGKHILEICPLPEQVIQQFSKLLLHQEIAFSNYQIHFLAKKGIYNLTLSKIKRDQAIRFVLLFQQVDDYEKLPVKVQASDSFFVSGMSHKLRTPLNIILGFSELLKNSSLNDEQLAFSNFINTAGENLLSVINDITEFMKIDAGHYISRECDFNLKELVKELSLRYEEKATKKNINFKCNIDENIPSLINGDQHLVILILENLLENAIKATVFGFVRLDVVYITDKFNKIKAQFIVTDTGYGIPKENHINLFKSFPKPGLEKNNGLESTGLGLAMADRLVKINKGEISFKSDVDKGSQFSVKLNFKASEVNVSPKVSNLVVDQEQKQVKNIKILLAEDLDLNQLLTQKILLKYGCELEVAEDGTKVIEKLKKNTYDLILMDLQMPKMDGYETTQYIRTQMPQAVKAIPIIALTAHAESGEKEKCLEMGMNDYLAKPFRSNELYDKIQAVFAGKKSISISTGQINTAIALNLDYLRKTFKGNPSFIVKIIEGGMEDIPKLMSEVMHSLTEENLDALSKSIVRLKSIFRLFGLHELGDLAQNIENISTYNAEDRMNIIEETVYQIETWIPNIMEQLTVELRKIESYN